ncbi:Txe/YoeB family addiction module toxin [Sphingobacterium alkalisoli]|uniref:Putative mRNA interferase YoeB n=1 Tax=Sphingobacterium alkalisoli TaxID=1874115 RepID=A0A4U0GUU6_9SPHI|nr:Txe/YoeB family addiction module toxin [Sphingobacterium alkalisoli]TJY61492.1 Txe/YoeB family addiction module toxin [Sphingobacterium alkalisoli]GGH30059.1 toxin YoeB [Sphingobacterium alkalisoli]
MEVIYTPQAVEDLKYWKKSGNKVVQKKIQQLITAIVENPFEGIGKPEQLKFELSGSWSRRINQEHRIIYELYENNKIVILEIQSVRGHYK